MGRRFNVYETIERIKKSPSMYLGECSITRLNLFLQGCFFLSAEHRIEVAAIPAFDGLHDWVAQRFSWQDSTAGWCKILLKECDGDEAKALDRFFELIDEYRRTAE